MAEIGFPELAIILIIVLVLFGPGRLPEVSAAIGRSIREFKQSLRDGEDTSANVDERLDAKQD